MADLTTTERNTVQPGLLFLWLLLATPLAARGATYHVAQRHPKASDENSGTSELPFKTISRAIVAVDPDKGDTVVVDMGIYREHVVLRKNKTRHTGIYTTYKAKPSARVVIKNSEVWNTTWRRSLR